MKNKLQIVGLVLFAVVFLAIAGGFWYFVAEQAQKEKALEEANAITAMYIETSSHGDYVFIQQDPGTGTLFTAEIPEDQIFELDGTEQKLIKMEKLVTGDILKLYGQGVMLESYPGQYPGVTKAVRIHRGEPEDAEKYEELWEELKPQAIFDPEQGVLAPENS